MRTLPTLLRSTPLFHDLDVLMGTLLDTRTPTVGAPTFSLRMDVTETPEAYTISAEMPGVAANQVDVHVAEGVLTIKGEKSAEALHEKANVRWTERSYGRFERRLSVPQDVAEADIKASFKDGVLTLTLPKSAPATPTVRKIDISAH